jgi:hypothetical protein
LGLALGEDAEGCRAVTGLPTIENILAQSS